MELSDLIAAVQAAKTKHELADLVSAELSLDLNKNKTLKALRAEVLNGLGITEDDTGAADDEKADVSAETEDQSASELSAVKPAADAVIVTQPLIIPPAEADQPVTVKSAPENRLVRNKATGVTFIWTAALSKLPVMEEV